MARPPVHSEPPPGEPAGPRQLADRRHRVRLLAVALAVALLAWFAVANLRQVRIDFWVFHRQAPLIVVILISGLLGALITFLVMRRSPKAGRAPKDG